MLEPLRVHIHATNPNVRELCQAYWQIIPRNRIPYFQFIYSVEELATHYGFSDKREVSAQASAGSYAEVHCSKCADLLTLTYRSHYIRLFDYHAMLEDKELTGPLCGDCQSQLDTPHRFVKRLFYDYMEQVYYRALQHFYAVVFPRINLTSLMKLEAVVPLFGARPYFNKDYFLQATVSFVIYDPATFLPLQVIDYDTSVNSERKEEKKIAFKRAAFATVGIPYFYLPKEVEAVFPEEKMAILDQEFHWVLKSRQSNLPQQDHLSESSREEEIPPELSL